jgi:phage gp45-like
MIRGIITSVVEGVVKRFSASGRADETISNREYFQHYGFTSRPLAGAEAIIIKDGNHIVMVATDDRRYRLGVDGGEVSIYTDEGDKIHLKRGKIIEIVGGEQIVSTTKAVETNASVSAALTSPEVTVTAATAFQVVGPLINLGGAREDLKALIDERFMALFNAHTHGNVEPGSGNSGGPNTTLTQSNVCTRVTKAG